jgi:hypothetical protein
MAPSDAHFVSDVSENVICIDITYICDQAELIESKFKDRGSKLLSVRV